MASRQVAGTRAKNDSTLSRNRREQKPAPQDGRGKHQLPSLPKRVNVGEPFDNLDVHVDSSAGRMRLLAQTLIFAFVIVLIALVHGCYRGDREVVVRIVDAATSVVSLVVGFLIGRVRRPPQ